MEFKGTKGDWKFYQKNHWCEVQVQEPLKSICAININVDEHIANAKLIESAPEMFDELLKIMERYDKGTETYIRVMKLLTKITQ